MARNDEKRYTPTEIIDRLGVGYYEILIDEYETRITNILSGNGDSNGEYTYKADSAFKDRAEKERKVEQLRKQIKKYQEIIDEINEAINTINHSVCVLERSAETFALIGGLSDSLRKCFLKYYDKEQTKGQLVRKPSETYDAIFTNKIGEKFFANAKSKYRRLWSKEYNKAEGARKKVKRDIYKKLKKIQNRMVVDESKYGYSPYYSPRYGNREKYDFNSLNGTFKEHNYSLKGFAGNIYSNISSKYNSFDVDSLGELGVEVDKVKRAIAISDGAERTFDEFGPILKSMEYLASEYSIQKRFKTFYFLREDLQRVEKLSREVECLDLIIDAYDNTAIKDTDLFKELVEIYRKQNKKLNNLSRKAMEIYERSGMKEYIEIEQKLRDLHQKAGSLRYQLSISEERLGYSDPETRKLNDMYFGARSEMLSIVLKYPELNRPEYGIDLTKYDKKGRYIGEEPEHKQIPENTGKSVKVEEEEPFVPTVVVTEEELRRDLGIEDEAPKQNPRKAWEVADESPVDENNFEIPENLTSMRTAYYSRYMVEKVKGSELGKMKFSEYLENVTPELEELIEIEKRRENRAKNVFKLYVQYLASLEDKSQAMRFSEFARLRHGLNEDDLPYEYTDEEVKKRLSL